jgi:hypothetical protein
MFVTQVLTQYSDEVLTALMSRVVVNQGGLNVSRHPHSECLGFRGMRNAMYYVLNARWTFTDVSRKMNQTLAGRKRYRSDSVDFLLYVSCSQILPPFIFCCVYVSCQQSSWPVIGTKIERLNWASVAR